MIKAMPMGSVGGIVPARILLNLVAFQAGWLAAVLGGAAGFAWPGVWAVVAVLTLHLSLTPAPLTEARLLLAATLIGTAFDNALLTAGLVSYPSGAVFAPAWMLALWPLFASAINLSLHWLKGRLLLAAAVGAIGGPLAYLAGQALGAIRLAPEALLVLALGWALLLPVLLALGRRWDGYAWARRSE